MSPDVIVLGGGIIGSSVAYFLARAGVKVLVLEQDPHPPQDQTASSSAARATGGFRVQYGTDINVRLSLLARQTLQNLEFETGYHPFGYLFLATSNSQMRSLEQALAVQRGAGLEVSKIVNPSEIATLNPALNLEGVVGGSYCPWDGFIRPLQLRRGFELGAQQHGATFVYGKNARLEPHNGRVVVHVDGSTLEAAAIVNATGAWAGTLGIDIPVTPEKRQIAETAPTLVLPPEMPMSVFCDTGFHLRVRDGRVLLLRPSPVRSNQPFDLSPDLDWTAPMLQEAHTRVPALNGLAVEQVWAGLYENSPDKHAIFGRHPELKNLFLVNGSSGHGTMHSPAFGVLMSELIVQGKTSSLETRVLRPERFLEGQEIVGNSLL
jgi:sarcosine oxidase, subunit beta